MLLDFAEFENSSFLSVIETISNRLKPQETNNYHI